MRVLMLFIIAFVIISGEVAAASVSGDVKQGNALYNKGDYEASMEKYEEALQKEAESDIINFNAGTASYKKKDYQKAVSHLQKSLLSEDPSLRGGAHYNIGNAYYKLGRGQEDKNIDMAISDLEKALDHYRNTLDIDDKDEDARYNYEFVQEEIKRLKEKKEQQQQQQNQENKDQKQKQGEQKQENKNQQQNQEEQGQENEQQQDTDDGQGDEHQPTSDDPGDERQAAGDGQDDERQAPNDDPGDDRQATIDGPSDERPATSDEMSPQEAEMLLNDYQQNEEPEGLINFMKRQGKESPVLKDW